jgi:uncharacterized protein
VHDAVTRLNGPQTTGRSFRNLSQPEHRVTTELDVPVEVRDGTRLMADVFRPASPGRFPTLVAFSPYPRQMQQSGFPAGLVEAGSTDFWVTRGYCHVIVNARGTGGSDGVYTLMDGQERADLHDAIEWAAAQVWCDGRVGMIGVSYFGMAQLMAAAEAPPSLKALFPFAAASGLRQATYHGGILSDLFLGGWLGAVGMLAPAGRAAMFRSWPAQALERVLNAEPLHRRFASFDGEAAIASLSKLMRFRYPPEPWADLYQQATAENPTGEEDFWRERDWAPLLGRAAAPLHLGCAWDNVALHLSGAFTAWEAVSDPAREPPLAARPRRAQLAVGVDARRGARLVRPLAEGPRHRCPRRPADPLLAARRRRISDAGCLAAALDDEPRHVPAVQRRPRRRRRRGRPRLLLHASRVAATGQSTAAAAAPGAELGR